MIVLNADESMLLLLTKNWEHKDNVLPRNKDGKLRKNANLYPGGDRYIQECMNVRCFGPNWKQYPDLIADVWGIYKNLFEKLLTPRMILRAYEDSTKSWRKTTMLRELLSELACLPVQNEIILDYSGVDHTGKAHLMECNNVESI